MAAINSLVSVEIDRGIVDTRSLISIHLIFIDLDQSARRWPIKQCSNSIKWLWKSPVKYWNVIWWWNRCVNIQQSDEIMLEWSWWPIGTIGAIKPCNDQRLLASLFTLFTYNVTNVNSFCTHCDCRSDGSCKTLGAMVWSLVDCDTLVLKHFQERSTRPKAALCTPQFNALFIQLCNSYNNTEHKFKQRLQNSSQDLWMQHLTVYKENPYWFV